MKMLRPRRAPGPGEIVVSCPVCHRLYIGAAAELIPALVTDYMIYCPNCGKKRHIYEEDVERG